MFGTALTAGFTGLIAHDHDQLQLSSGEVLAKFPESWQGRSTPESLCQHLHESAASLAELGTDPSVDDVFAIVRDCKDAALLGPARHAHALICAMGLEAVCMLANQLVPMFVDCGGMEDADRVFLGLSCPDDNVLNLLIEEYLELGESLHAVDLFLKKQEDIYLEKRSCLTLLKVSASIKSMGLSQKVHESIIKEGLELDPFVSHTLIDVYGKCNLLLEAREVFDNLLVRNVVSWTALIGAYANQGSYEKALGCLEQMQSEGLSGNVMTFVCALKACGNAKALEKGRELHMDLVKRGIEDNVFTGNTLMDMYLKCGSFNEASKSFDCICIKDVFSWTALIAGCIEHGLNNEAVDCLERMQGEGVLPNAVTFKCGLKACGKAGALGRGQQLHMELAKQGLDDLSAVGNTLIDFYGKCGLLPEANAVFDKLPVRTVVTWNILIARYTHSGLGVEALKCLEQMQLEGISPAASTFLLYLKACNTLRDLHEGFEMHCLITKMGYLEDLHVGSAIIGMYLKCCSLAEARYLFDTFSSHDVSLWTAMIAACADEGQTNEAIFLYSQMQEQGLCPNIVTFVSILKLCGSSGLLRYGRYIHAQTCMVDSDELTEISLETVIMDMYIKCGSMAEASAVFNGVSDSPMNLVRWSAILTGYARYGDKKHTLHLLQNIVKQGIKPDGVLLLSILTVCNHAGLADDGLVYFELLNQTCRISLSVEHFNCLIDMLSRLGRLEEAMTVLKEMPFLASSTAWHTVLNVCRQWGYAGCGSFAFQELVVSDKEYDAGYVLMSNMWLDIPDAAGI